MNTIMYLIERKRAFWGAISYPRWPFGADIMRAIRYKVT